MTAVRSFCPADTQIFIVAGLDSVAILNRECGFRMQGSFRMDPLASHSDSGYLRQFRCKSCTSTEAVRPDKSGSRHKKVKFLWYTGPALCPFLCRRLNNHEPRAYILWLVLLSESAPHCAARLTRRACRRLDLTSATCNSEPRGKYSHHSFLPSQAKPKTC